MSIRLDDRSHDFRFAFADRLQFYVRRVDKKTGCESFSTEKWRVQSMTGGGDSIGRHPACLSEQELLAECRINRTRRGGPGGQHRNKVETAVFVEHLPTGIQAEANERRSQRANQRVALFRLRRELALQFRCDRSAGLDAQTERLWQSRLQGSRLNVSAAHEDFPCLLALALDVIDSVDGRISDAARRLGTTSSQLTRFLKRDRYVLDSVNRQRQSAGWHRIR